MNNSKSCVVQNHKIDLSSRFWSSPEIRSQLSYISRLVRGIQSTIATTRKRENPLKTAQKMASEISTKQDEEATTEEVPGSIAIYTEKEINTVNRDVTLSVLSLGHFISFSFATKEVKGATYFLSRYSLTQWQFWQANLKWLSGARAQDENK